MSFKIINLDTLEKLCTKRSDVEALYIVGESGSGKSTLRKDLIEKLNQTSDSTIIIEPYIIAMEDSNNKGKTLKARDIA